MGGREIKLVAILTVQDQDNDSLKSAMAVTMQESTYLHRLSGGREQGKGKERNHKSLPSL